MSMPPTKTNLKQFLSVPTIFTILTVCLWLFYFLDLLTLRKNFLGDAGAYYGHMKYFIENIRFGVYPLWDPGSGHGSLNEFFLRRLGEFNPFFWLMSLLSSLGVDFMLTYRWFLAAYFLLGVWGFYRLARLVLNDRFSAFIAYALLLFSSLGARTFESYLVYEITPFIWFFYFFLAQLIYPRWVNFLGTSFCAMIITITYIPFYFLTGLLTFVFVAGVVYWKDLSKVWAQQVAFMLSHKLCTLLCVLALMASLLPGMLWYMESSSGETLPRGRHVGAESTNSAAVAIDRVNEGGIVAPLIIDQNFSSFDQLKPGDFYVPIVAFLILACGLWTAMNRKLILLALWGFLIFLIGLADASGLHPLLYKYVFFFKYFRNLQFFLWLFLLPAFILFVAEIFRQMVAVLPAKGADRRLLAGYFGLAHIAGAIFLWSNDHGQISSYVSIAISFLFFIGLVYDLLNIRLQWGLVLLVFAIVIPSTDLHKHLLGEYSAWKRWDYSGRPGIKEPDTLKWNIPKDKKKESPPYFSSNAFYVLWDNVDSGVLNEHLAYPFIFYDRLSIIDERAVDFVQIEHNLSKRANLATIPLEQAHQVPMDYNSASPSLPEADFWLKGDPRLRIKKINANELILMTNLSRPRFLVYNCNYHSKWRVFIDGKSAPLFRANVAFQGLWLPAGEHEVVFRYASWWRYAVAYGLFAVFALALVFLIFGLAKEGFYGRNTSY